MRNQVKVKFIKALMNMMMISSVLLLHSSLSTAFPSTESRNAFKNQKMGMAASSFYSSLGMDLNSNLYSENSYERQSGLDVTTSLGYLWNSSIYSAVSGTVSTDLRGQRNSTLSNFKIVSGNKYSKSENYKAQYYFYGVAPTNEDARNIVTFRGGVGLGHSLTVSFKNFFVPYDLKLGVDFQKNFHEYDIALDGIPNTEMNLFVAPGISLNFTEKSSLTITGTYITARSYQGTLKQKFDADILTSYQLSKQVSCNLGIANRGDLLKSNGTDSNFAFLNEQTNFLHAGIVWQL